MPRYSAFIALDTGDYREVDDVIEAPDPQGAARQVIDSETIQARDNFPIILIVEEQAVSVFTRDRDGRIATPADTIERHIRDRQDGPKLHLLSEGGWNE